MMSSLQTYYRPKDRREAIDLLGQSGSQALPLSLSTRVPVEGYRGSEAVVDLSELNLSYIDQAEQASIRIGSQTTLQTVAESPVVQSHASGILAEAAHLSTHLGMRNLATIGGVARVPERSPEVLLALFVLAAQATLEGATGQSTHALTEPLP